MSRFQRSQRHRPKPDANVRISPLDTASNRSARVRDYLTSRSSGRRRSGGLESHVLSVVASIGDISSHKALNSASVMRLSFSLRSRTATDTKCAVSGLPPFASAARHSSRVARTESNRSSESNTSVSRYLTRRAHRLPSRWSITSRQLSSVRSILEAAGRPRLGHHWPGRRAAFPGIPRLAHQINLQTLQRLLQGLRRRSFNTFSPQVATPLTFPGYRRNG
jgi:hypothetical protein